MARIWTSGFEYNDPNSGEEFTNVSGAGATISSSIFRSGAYAGHTVPSAAAATFRYNWSGSNVEDGFYFRFYLYIAALGTAGRRIFSVGSTAANKISVILNTDGTLNISNQEDSITLTGTSAALSTSTWYRVELKVDCTTIASTVVTAKLNGTTFVNEQTANLTTGMARIILGGDVTDATLDLYWDDIAINDDSGSAQNTYPGDGKVIRLKPNAAGDANTFSTQAGGTAGSSNNFTRVNEILPDSATSRNGSNTLNEEDMFNVESASLSAADTINCVILECFRRNPTADATTTAKMQIKKTSGGTITQSDDIIPNSNSWAFSRYVTYLDPDGSAWTPTGTIESMQIGYILTVTGTNRIDFSTMSAIVDYTPAAVTLSHGALGLLGLI